MRKARRYRGLATRDDKMFRVYMCALRKEPRLERVNRKTVEQGAT